MINTNRVKVGGFATEIPKPLNLELKTYITTEIEVYETSMRDNQDGSFDQIFRSKVNGSTVIKQEGEKDPIIGKSKRSHSAQFQAKMFRENPDRSFYERVMEKLIAKPTEEILDFLG